MRSRLLVISAVLVGLGGCGGGDDAADTTAAGGGAGAAGSGASGGNAGKAGAGGGAGKGTGGSAGKSGGGGAGGTGGGGKAGSGGTTGGNGGTSAGSGGTATGGTGTAGTGTAGTGTAGGAAGTGVGGGGTAGGGGGGTGGTGTAGSGGIAIGEWTDAPGACPTGVPQKDITSLTELEDATRGEGAFAGDAPETCYLIHDGTYVQSGSTLAAYVKVGGVDATHRRLFVGQSRKGVVIRGRATIDAGVSHVRLTNLTFDLNGYSQSGSFNTLSMLDGSVDLRIDHIDFTGDCKTGANGGHVEVDGSSDVVVEACLIEKFGRCGPMGHQDHGVYLASGSQIVVRDNDIRGNASRGIQLNTEGGTFGTLDQITLEQNRIHDNGHADYEDGIVMNATGTGTISNVVVQHNLFYGNYYSGLRVVGTVFQSVAVTKNTFFHDGVASSGAFRSEANIDSMGSGANTVFSKNVFVAVAPVLYSCFDATPRGFSLGDNVAQGTLPSGPDGACVSGTVAIDPMLKDPAAFDFHATNPAAAGYGAYAPLAPDRPRRNCTGRREDRKKSGRNGLWAVSQSPHLPGFRSSCSIPNGRHEPQHGDLRSVEGLGHVERFDEGEAAASVGAEGGEVDAVVVVGKRIELGEAAAEQADGTVGALHHEQLVERGGDLDEPLQKPAARLVGLGAPQRLPRLVRGPVLAGGVEAGAFEEIAHGRGVAPLCTRRDVALHEASQ
jgi:hypothetical protein